MNITNPLRRRTLILIAILPCAVCAMAQSFQPTRCSPPPNDSYFQSRGIHAYPGFTYNLGGEHAQFSSCEGLPPAGATNDHPFNSTANLEINGVCVQAPAMCNVRVSHTNDIGCAEFYSTEMLQLDINGGELPPGMMIRQSPTQRSLGQLSVRPASGGGYLVDSFFDVWTELSLDGGTTWSAGTNSVQMTLTNNSPQVTSTNNRMPALDSRYSSRARSSVVYCANGTNSNGILLSNMIQSAFSASLPQPPLNGSVLHSYNVQADFQISFDGGATFANHHAVGNVAVLVHHTKDLEGTQFFEDEMLQLDIQGGTLPGGFRIRESPTKSSLGRSYIRPTAAGFMISDYFDIYTEVTTDNGATWTPACCPIRLALSAPPSYPPSVSALNPLVYFHLDETNQPPLGPYPAINLGNLGPAGNGTYFGGTPGVTGALAGNADTAARFNGAVVVPYSAPLSLNAPFTIETWLKAAATTAGTLCPLSCGTLSGNRSGWLIYQNGTSGWNLRMYSGLDTNTSVNVNAGGPTIAGKWYHLAATYNGSTASLYVNGVGTTTSAPPPFAPNMNGPLTIGMRSDGAFPWPGTADEVAIYNVVLSPAEILTHYQNGTNTSPPFPYQQMILGRNPLIYLRLDEPALPQAVDSGVLGSSANGTYEPGIIPGVVGVPLPGFGPINFGCQFNGANGYLDVPGAGLDLRGPVTVVCWCQAPPANGIFQTIVGKGDTSYRLDLDWNGYPRFADDINPDAVGTTLIGDGQWHFLAGTYDGFTNSLYLDGLLNGWKEAPNPITGNPNDLWIGGAPDYGVNRLFNGVVDDVAIFPYALSPAQIQQLFAASFRAGGVPPRAEQFGLNIYRIGDQIKLVWCSGTLQVASAPSGPYTDLNGLPSPHVLTPVADQLFFRVRQ